MEFFIFIKEGIRELFNRPSANYKALDGLRAFAITFVLCFHVTEYFTKNIGFDLGFFGNLFPFRGGWVGVPLFFVLSGFLIGGQLWKELIQKKSIHMIKFILRRGFRIWPLYYFILVVICIFKISTDYDQLGLFSNLLFIGNYLSDNGPISGSWSLATEEQFYILAPLLLIIILKFPRKKKELELFHYRKILIILFFLPLLFRVITWNFILEMTHFDLIVYMRHIYRPFHTNCEGLLAGMILSNFYYDKKSFMGRPLFRPWFFGAMSFSFFVLSFYSKVYLNFTGVALSFSFLVIYLLKTEGFFTKILSSDILYVISKTSFAIYLVHVYVIKYFLPLALVKKMSLGISHLEIIIAFCISFFISLLLGMILFIFVERPFLELRKKYESLVFFSSI